MRVLLVNPGADVYGSDLQVLESVRALGRAGHEVRVVAPDDGPLVALLRNAGATVDVQPFPVVRRAYLSPGGLARLGREVAQALPRLRRLVKADPVDVLYVNTVTIPWWILAGRSVGVPTVVHVHEAEDADPGVVRRAMAAPLLGATRVVFNSMTARRAALEVMPRLERRSVVVLNGVPDRAEAPLPLPTGAPYRLGMVGRLSERKSQHVAVEAVDLLRRAGHDVHLEIAGTVYPGNESYEARLHEDVERLDLGDRVTFSGYVSPSSVVFDRSHVALSLSVRESLGNVVVEAQLARRPVVATAAGGHLETVVDDVTGLLVPVDDAAAVAAAVTRLLTDPETARRLADAGRRSALETFGTDRYGSAIVSALSGVVR